MEGKSLSESLLVDDVVKSKQKEDRKKKDSSSCCRRPILCITGRICGNTWTRLLSFWALLEIGIVGVNVPVLWNQQPLYARVVLSILGVLVLLFMWSWERTGMSSSVIDNPPPSNMKDHDLKKLRICSKCERWKPERCHHCKICGVCVLKMDHHCPWIGVCIGIKNYKAFCLFITYTCLCQIAIAVTIFPETLILPSREEEVQNTDKAIAIYGLELNIVTTLMFILASLLSFAMMFFMHRHVRQILSGKTTVETILDLPVFLEDQTAIERFQEIFGSSSWRWPFPLAEREPDGYSFKPLKWPSQSSKSPSESSKEDQATPTLSIVIVEDERLGNTSINSTGRGKSRLMVDSKYLAPHKPIGSSRRYSKRSSHKSKSSFSHKIIYGGNCIDSDEE